MGEIDLEYTPITAPLPALAPVLALDTLRRELEACRRERDEFTADCAGLVQVVQRQRADLARCVTALRCVLDGMTVQELCALGDLVEDIEARWGLGK